MRCTVVLAVLGLMTVATAAASAKPVVTHFKSPSGNINCIGGTTPVYVECLVRHATWAHVPVKPSACDLDFQPFDIALGQRRVTLGACRGDIGPLCVNDCTTLRYGSSVDIGPIRCRSAVIGVTCRYVSGKLAGFRIARERYIVWRA